MTNKQKTNVCICTMHIFKYEIFSLMVLLEEDRDQGGSASVVSQEKTFRDTCMKI